MATRGQRAQAERLAQEAVEIGGGTDLLNVQADAYSDLADVLLLAGEREEAAIALERALSRYTRKGNIVMAKRTRARLAEA
jgi:tetratricopeptide (TPR) repeat protein